MEQRKVSPPQIQRAREYTLSGGMVYPMDLGFILETGYACCCNIIMQSYSDSGSLTLHLQLRSHRNIPRRIFAIELHLSIHLCITKEELNSDDFPVGDLPRIVAI